MNLYKKKSIGAPLSKLAYDAILLALSNSPAPHNFFPLWHSSNWPKGQNYTGYANREVDELSEAFPTELDEEKRKEMSLRIQEILQEDMPAIPLYNPKYKVARHKRFNNESVYKQIPIIFAGNLQVLREDQ